MNDNIIIIDTDGCERPKADMSYEEVRDVLYEKNGCEKATIVVQAYGRIGKTRQCVEHILKYTKDISFKLVLLDNGSVEKDVMDYFKSIDYVDKTIIRFTKNITGVYAIDKVMHMVDTKYLVIVNNDVLVTPKWLYNLKKCADSDSRIGMVCPVSTNITCGQEENLGGFHTIEEMLTKAEKYNISNSAKWEERLRMIPTATLYRREIFEKAGMYDTGFLHDWGDDDFTFRIRHAGYKLMLCRDTFVHHNHNVREMEDKNPAEANKLAKSGRTIFQQRHHGIDSWNDTNDTIAFLLKQFNADIKYGDCVESLSVDCKCGAMVLDVRNYFRKKGMLNVHTTALVNDIKYYHELQHVADQVIWGTPEEVNGKQVYDFIVVGKSLNQYTDPKKIFTKVYEMLAEEGIIIFNLDNGADYRQFLYCLGIKELREREMPRILHQEEIMDWIHQVGGDMQDILSDYHCIDDELKKMVETIIYQIESGFLNKHADDVIAHLLVKQYWFIVKKPIEKEAH